MRIKYKCLLITSILLMIGLTTVSATDLSDNTGLPNQLTTSMNYNSMDNTIVDSSSANSKTVQDDSVDTIDTPNQKNYTNSNLKNDYAVVTDITEENYNQYFRYNAKKGHTETTELVYEGDILNLQGTFTGLNFTIDKSNVILTSIGKTAKLYNCTPSIMGENTTGIQIHNLTITNNNDYGMGIYINHTQNATIANNTVLCWGYSGFGFVGNFMYHSTIQDNYFKTTFREGFENSDINTYQAMHSASVFGYADYNNIINNTMTCLRSNGIYFSIWGSGLFVGGPCNFNNVTGNTVYGGDTAWSYAIQAIGANNTITYNKVQGAYRGISTQDYPGIVIRYNDINATAQGIFACEDAIVTDNKIRVNSKCVGIEISGNNAIVSKNNISTENGTGILIGSSYTNIKVHNNTIQTTNGYGIYTKGKSSKINITYNHINSGKEGIMFKKLSSNKKPNYLYVGNNIIESLKSDYAIDLSECGAKEFVDNVVYVYDSNVISSKRGIGLEKAYAQPVNASISSDSPDSNLTYIVNSKNYDDYFDNEGILKTKIIQKNDTIILNGTFTNKTFVFTIKIHVIGNNCILKDCNVSFTGDADSSSIKNITIRNTYRKSLNRHAIEIMEVNNCLITNVTINNYDPWESFGILLYSSFGNTITYNNIYTSGDFVNYGIFLYASDMNNISNNYVHINESDADYGYSDEIMFEDKIGTIKEILNNFGIVLVYSSTNYIDNNTVIGVSQFSEYTPVTDNHKNSIVGIDLYFDSNNNKIRNNTINIKSYGPYTYGMGVLGAPWGSSIKSLNATNNYFAYNKVSVTGGFFTTGFISGLNSINTTIDHNEFNIQSLHNTTSLGDYAYGLTLESSYNNTYTNNKLTAKGVAVYSIEIFESRNNTIKNNTIKATGTYPYGVAGSRIINNNITNNNINITQSSHGNSVNQTYHTDSIPLGNNGIYLMNRCINNTITTNYIHTNGNYSVYLADTVVSTTVTNNSLLSIKNIGDDSTYKTSKTNNISNNFLYFTELNITTESGKVGQPITLSAQVKSDTNNLENITATFRFGNTNVGQAKVNKGTVTIVYTVPKNWNSGNAYKLIISINGTNFQNTTQTKNIKITKELIDTKITIPTVRGTPGSTVQIKANITDIYNSSVIGQATLKINGQNIETKNVTNGTITYTYKIPTNYQSKEYPITITFNQTKDYKASTATSTLGVQTKVIITTNPTTTTINNKTTLTATLTANGKAVTGGKVQITINNKTITNTTVNNGKITYTFTPQENTYGQHNYTLQYKYTGNNTLTDATTTTKLNIQKTNTKITTTITPKTTTQGKQINITITITSTTNPQIKPNTGTIALKINQKIIKNTTTNTPLLLPITNGTAKLTFTTTNNLQPKNNLTIIYSGNHQLNPTTTTITNAITIQQKLTTNKLNEGNTHYVTNETYSQYFNNEGTTDYVKNNDTLILNGSFNDKIITIDKTGITLTGNEETNLINSIIIINEEIENVTVSNINFETDKYEYTINNLGSNCIIHNNTINISNLEILPNGILDNGFDNEITDNNIIITKPKNSIEFKLYNYSPNSKMSLNESKSTIIQDNTYNNII